MKLTALAFSCVLAGTSLAGAGPRHGPRPLPAQTGVASWYGWHEHGRKMANGRRFRALGTSAASKTLPLGTRAKVTNLKNHRSAFVTVEDRGPGVPGRILDVSLGTARVLGMEQDGLTQVRVQPVGKTARNRHRHHR